MQDLSHPLNQIQYVTNFSDLVSTSFHGDINAICWTRNLVGDFAEIIEKVELNENILNCGQREKKLRGARKYFGKGSLKLERF